MQWDSDGTYENYVNHHDLKLNGKNHSFNAQDIFRYKVGQEVVNIKNGRRGKIVTRHALTGHALIINDIRDATYDVEWINAKFPEKNVSHMDLATIDRYYWSKWTRGRRVRYNYPTVWNDVSTDSVNPVGTIIDVGYHGGTKFKIQWEQHKEGWTMNCDAYGTDKLWLLPLEK